MNRSAQSPLPIFQSLETFSATFSKPWNNTGFRFQGLGNYLHATVVFLVLATCGCVSNRIPEQQGVDRYKAIMWTWHEEINGKLTPFIAQFKLLPEQYRQMNQDEKAKFQALFSQHYRAWSTINGKYADLLAAEKPTLSFQFPYSKTHQFLTINRDMGSECARLWVSNELAQVGNIERQKGQLSHDCAMELEQWFKAHNATELWKLFEFEVLNDDMRRYQKTHSDPKLGK